MKKSSPAEITQAVENARKLIAAKSAKPAPPQPEQPFIPSDKDPNPNRLQSTRAAAKALGYVSECNWRGSLRNFCVKQWEIIAASAPTLFSYDFKDGGACFDYYDKNGWEKRVIAWLQLAHHAYLTLAHKRSNPRQIKSSLKKTAKRRS